jgi:peptide deformylase
MKFDAKTVARWNEIVVEYVNGSGYEISDVKTGSLAWAIAHKTKITHEAYEDNSVVDAHIKTVLQKIFPGAVFKDNYSY